MGQRCMESGRQRKEAVGHFECRGTGYARFDLHICLIVLQNPFLTDYSSPKCTRSSIRCMQVFVPRFLTADRVSTPIVAIRCSRMAPASRSTCPQTSEVLSIMLFMDVNLISIFNDNTSSTWSGNAVSDYSAEEGTAELCDSGLPDPEVCDVLHLPPKETAVVSEAWSRGSVPIHTHEAMEHVTCLLMCTPVMSILPKVWCAAGDGYLGYWCCRAHHPWCWICTRTC